MIQHVTSLASRNFTTMFASCRAEKSPNSFQCDVSKAYSLMNGEDLSGWSIFKVAIKESIDVFTPEEFSFCISGDVYFFDDSTPIWCLLGCYVKKKDVRKNQY